MIPKQFHFWKIIPISLVIQGESLKISEHHPKKSSWKKQEIRVNLPFLPWIFGHRVMGVSTDDLMQFVTEEPGFGGCWKARSGSVAPRELERRTVVEQQHSIGIIDDRTGCMWVTHTVYIYIIHDTYIYIYYTWYMYRLYNIYIIHDTCIDYIIYIYIHVWII